MASRTYDLTTRREAALDLVIKWCDPKVLNTCPYKCPSLYTVAQHGTTLCSNDASPFIAFAQYGSALGRILLVALELQVVAACHAFYQL
jgi:hypothetical protein